MAPEFTLLRSRAAFNRYASKHIDRRPQRADYPEGRDGAERHEHDLRQWASTIDRVAPARFPCLVVLVVASFGYEELRPVYLYPEDAQRFLNRL